MRNESEATRFCFKDLGDQPKGSSLMVIGAGSAVLYFYVDGYSVQENQVVGFCRTVDENLQAGAKPILAFSPKDHPWMVVDASYAETFTVGEAREQYRVDLAEKTRVQKELQGIYDRVRAGEEPLVNNPAPEEATGQGDQAEPFNLTDLNEWLRRQARRDEEKGYDE